jgi:pimeloyl-ACP methyl ester carboxylesterase
MPTAATSTSFTVASKKGQRLSLAASHWQQALLLWTTSVLGCVLTMACIKLSPIHQRFMQKEVENIRQYYTSHWVPPNKRRLLNYALAWLWAYWAAVQRLLGLSPKARQDYYAMNRQASFVNQNVPTLEAYLAKTPSEVQPLASAQTPLIIVPGLNTPPAFFREMVGYFQGKGYWVLVASMPKQGFATIGEAAVCLEAQLKTLSQQCGIKQVHLVGHSLGGLIAQTVASTLQERAELNSVPNLLEPPITIKTLVALGTGFSGADGVAYLQQLWQENHPGQVTPKVFDEVIQWKRNWVKGAGLACHSIWTIWDFVVPFQKGWLAPVEGAWSKYTQVYNHLLEDCNIDHLSLALHPKVFAKIEQCLNPLVAVVASAPVFPANLLSSTKHQPAPAGG